MAGPIDEQALLELLRAGDEAAAQQVFNAYVRSLLQLARSHLSQRMARRVDPEDIVQSVFRTFFSRAKEGRFTVESNDDLGKILVGITVRKALRHVAVHTAAKRDYSKEESSDGEGMATMAAIQDVQPTPTAAVAFLDQLEHLFNRLRPQERKVLEMRLHGYSTLEIASELGSSDRHVRRALEHIRTIAEEEDLGP
jgi:RNA polymerase sigma-70 factor (ECF subfamily)